MASIPNRRYTVAEYLELEAKSEEKHEYYDGEIFAMSGAKKEHVRISGNLFHAIRKQLEGKPCEPFNSDMAVRPSPTFYTFPDISVACGAEFQTGAIDVLLNPRVIIEVLSPSTERRDRHFKFGHYQQMSSVHEIVFVTQDTPFVERFVRLPEALWQFDNVSGLEGTLRLASIDCELSMAEIYQGVEFPPDDSNHGLLTREELLSRVK